MQYMILKELEEDQKRVQQFLKMEEDPIMSKHIKSLKKTLRSFDEYERIGMEAYYGWVYVLDGFTRLLMKMYTKSKDDDIFTTKRINDLLKKPSVETETIETKQDLYDFLIWKSSCLLSMGHGEEYAASIVNCYCDSNLISFKQIFLLKKKDETFDKILSEFEFDMNPISFLLNMMIDIEEMNITNPLILYYLCYCQTLCIPKHHILAFFVETKGLKLLFDAMISKSIENYNIYSLLLIARFLNEIVLNYPKICNYIFSEESKLYKKLFLFWIKYMRYYWKIKKNVNDTFLDKLYLLPMIISSVTPFQAMDNNPVRCLYILKDKHLLFGFLMDLITNILTTTIAQSKPYWIVGDNFDNIMNHLSSKKNCHFLFIWFIEQYKMNINCYKKSYAKTWIQHFDDYFMGDDHYDSDDSDLYSNDEYCEYEKCYSKFKQFEYNIHNICSIRWIICHYHHENQLKDSNIKKTQNVDELFSRYNLYRSLLSLKIKNIGKSRSIYWKLLNKAMDTTIFPPKIKSLKKTIYKYTKCSSTYCIKNKLENKMYECCGCKFVKYCSRKCQKRDWKYYHRSLCKIMAMYA